MKQLIIALLLLSIFSCKPATAQIKFNGDLENIDPATKLPVNWHKASDSTYEIKLDSVVKQHGKYSVSLTRKAGSGIFGNIMFYTPTRFNGKEIELRGYIKTENVTGGNAGFWLRIDGTPAFNNMENQNVHGTTDWKQYSIKLPYDDEKAININAGVLLVGNGKMWFDNVELLIDGKPIDEAAIKKIEVTKAQQDTAFSKGSGIGQITATAREVKNLAMLGEVWGFIKYHHPEVAKGNFNMDAELFRVMPEVIKAANNAELSGVLEQWVDKFGMVTKCNNCKPPTGADIMQSADYGHIFDNTVLSKSLTNKLTYILNNSNIDKNYYIDMVWQVGSPIFNNENAYAYMNYPDAGYRLLCLYRYWNMIQYFYPDKHLIGEDWDKALPEFIPKFIDDKDAQAYVITTLELISRIHDTHANIWNNSTELTNFRGKFAVPFQAKFIENKLVVTGYYNDTLDVKSKFKIGDIITAINGVSVDELIKKYLPVSAASNYSTQLRDMPRYYLLRNNNQHFNFSVLSDGKTSTVEIDGTEKVNHKLDFDTKPDGPAYYLINKQIGYLYPGRYYNKDLDTIEKLFKNTKGIVIDMRCYPSEFMPFTFVPFIKTGDAPFVKFTTGRVAHPGYFTLEKPLNITPTASYKGKVVVIVNEVTQSQAEYTTMAFQSSPNVTVIGSTTAGADGNVSAIALPGGISTMVSGIGVLYPDGTETQRKGVKIDEVVKPTIQGIKAGKDELLERVEAIIEGR